MNEISKKAESSEDMIPLAEGPGQTLRIAREAMGLSQEDIAANLHLTVRHIRYIEANDYSKTNGLTFERGYIRAFSRAVNVPEDEMIAAFNQLGLEEKHVPLPCGFSARPITTKSRGQQWFVMAGFGCLFVLMLVWWAMSGRTVVSSATAPTVVGSLNATTTDADAQSSLTVEPGGKQAQAGHHVDTSDQQVNG